MLDLGSNESQNGQNGAKYNMMEMVAAAENEKTFGASNVPQTVIKSHVETASQQIDGMMMDMAGDTNH